MTRKLLLCFLIGATICLSAAVVIATCGDTWSSLPPVYEPPRVALGNCLDTLSGGDSTSKINPTTTKKIVLTNIYWLDGHEKQVWVSDFGENRDVGIVFEDCLRCFPSFGFPFWEHTNSTLGSGTSYWNQITRTAKSLSNGLCPILPDTHRNRYGHTCGGSTSFNCTTPGFTGGCPPGTSPDGFGFCCPTNTASCSAAFAAKCMLLDGDYDALTCTCAGCGGCSGSPIMVDVNGDGFALTSASEGVAFDLNGDGTTPDQMAWTTAGGDDAWLALDRDLDGKINNGTELFGNFSPQPPIEKSERNGFLALAEWDKTVNGGNNDGKITTDDQIFASLRLWRDSNHNGVSESGELHSLPEFALDALELDFKESKRVDEFGNKWKYRAKVSDNQKAHVGRWAWDVFLSQSNPITP